MKILFTVFGKIPQNWVKEFNFKTEYMNTIKLLSQENDVVVLQTSDDYVYDGITYASYENVNLDDFDKLFIYSGSVNFFGGKCSEPVAWQLNTIAKWRKPCIFYQVDVDHYLDEKIFDRALRENWIDSKPDFKNVHMIWASKKSDDKYKTNTYNMNAFLMLDDNLNFENININNKLVLTSFGSSSWKTCFRKKRVIDVLENCKELKAMNLLFWKTNLNDYKEYLPQTVVLDSRKCPYEDFKSYTTNSLTSLCVSVKHKSSALLNRMIECINFGTLPLIDDESFSNDIISFFPHTLIYRGKSTLSFLKDNLYNREYYLELLNLTYNNLKLLKEKTKSKILEVIKYE